MFDVSSETENGDNDNDPRFPGFEVERFGVGKTRKTEMKVRKLFV